MNKESANLKMKTVAQAMKSRMKLIKGIIVALSIKVMLVNEKVSAKKHRIFRIVKTNNLNKLLWTGTELP